MKIFFIHGNRGKKFAVLLDRGKHDVVAIEFNTTNNLARCWKLLKAIIGHGRPGLVIADDHGLFAFYAYVTARLAGSPYFIRLRGDNWDEEEVRLREKSGFAKLKFAASRWLYFRLGNFALKNANSIISVSQYLKEVVVARLGISATKVTVIPVPVLIDDPGDTASAQTKMIAKKQLALTEGPIALMVTNFRFLKKVAAIFHFWPQLESLFQAQPDLTLLIAGDGPYLEATALRLAPWLRSKKVVLLKHQDNIPTLMRAADLFIHLSFQDAFPNVVIEAQALGLPTIVNNSCGMPEQVQHGVSGFVIDNNDPMMLANASISVLTNSELTATMSSAAKSYVRMRFSIEQARKTFDELLGDLK